MGWFSGTRSGRRVVTHSGTTDRYHADIVMIPAEQRAVVDLVAGQWLSNAAATVQRCHRGAGGRITTRRSGVPDRDGGAVGGPGPPS